MSHVKRPRSEADLDSSVTSSPLEANEFMPIFESFRNELDEHHDRRERVTKTSRDITALSKKM